MRYIYLHNPETAELVERLEYDRGCRLIDTTGGYYELEFPAAQTGVEEGAIAQEVFLRHFGSDDAQRAAFGGRLTPDEIPIDAFGPCKCGCVGRMLKRETS